MMIDTNAVQKLEIKRTTSGHEFFLDEYPLTDPTTNREHLVMTVALHRLHSKEPQFAALRFLLDGAGQDHDGTGWPAFAVALNATHLRRKTGGLLPKLSKWSAQSDLQRSSRVEPLTGLDGSEVKPYEYMRQHMRQWQDEFSGEPDRAAIYAESGDPADPPTDFPPPNPKFAKCAQDNADSFEAEHGSLFQNKQDDKDDGVLTVDFHSEFTADLLKLAENCSVELDPVLGSRVLDQTMCKLFLRALAEIKKEFPDDWEEIDEYGHRLHRLFYLTHPELGDSLLCYPALDADGEMVLTVHDLGQLALDQLSEFNAHDLLAIAAFQPARLKALIARIAASAAGMRFLMQTGLTKTEFERARKLVSIDDSETHEQTGQGASKTVATRAAVDDAALQGIDLQRAIDTIYERLAHGLKAGVITEKERRLLGAVFGEVDRPTGDELAARFRYTSRSAVSRATRNAREKLRRAAPSDMKIARLYDALAALRDL